MRFWRHSQLLASECPWKGWLPMTRVTFLSQLKNQGKDIFWVPGDSRHPGRGGPESQHTRAGLLPLPPFLSPWRSQWPGLPWPRMDLGSSHCSPQVHPHSAADSFDPHNLEGSWVKCHFYYPAEETGDWPQVTWLIHASAQSLVSSSHSLKVVQLL